MYKFLTYYGSCRSKYQSWIIMRIKLIALFIGLAIMNVCASVRAQMITLNADRAPIKQVFDEISKQSGYMFMYKNVLLKDTKPVTVKLQKVDLEQILKACFEGQPLTYEIVDQTIVVLPKPATPARKVIKRIRGRVSNEKREPLSGVSVQIKDTKTGTVTDAQGLYTIDAEENSILLFSYLGYQNQEIQIANKEVINVVMQESIGQLDEMQVIAYGKTTRRLSTGNTVSIKAADIAKSPVSNALLALQGRVPGLEITQLNGLPNGGITVRIQGLNSIGQGNEPFYVVDGVPYSATSQQSISNQYAVGSSPLYFLNPASIESIEILKDADATAIYGSKAANGAILITTKKGQVGQTNIDVNFQQGIGKVPRRLELLNTEQYLQVRMDAKRNDNLGITSTDYDLNGLWDKNRYTDWQDVLIGGTANYTNAQLNISGGSINTQFLIGGGYNRETTVFPGNLSDQKGSLQFSINHSSENRKFKAQLSGNYLRDLNNFTNADFTGSALNLAPNAPSIYNPNGSVNWQPTATGNATWSNPIAVLTQLYRNKTDNLMLNGLLGYTLLKRLEIKSTFGYSRLEAEEIVTIPSSSIRPESITAGTKPSALFSNKYTDTWIAEPQLNYHYEKPFGKFDLLIGSTFQQNQNDLKSFRANNFSNDQQLENIGSAGTVVVNASTNTLYKYNALFGRISYNYNDIYLLNFNARRDGSSRFGKENQFQNFYAVGGAWVFSKEKFFKCLNQLVSFGKLKASYGTTGNDQVPDYNFLSLYTSITSAIGVPYQNVVGLQPTGLPNPYLQWELTKKLNLGLDLGFLNDRILLNANFYKNSSSNQLLSNPLSIVTGFSLIQSNLPATVQNSGWEFILDAQPVKQHKFNWNTSFNVAISRNKLVSFPGLADNTNYQSSYFIGESISQAILYKGGGVNPLSGLYQFINSQRQYVASPNILTDRTAHLNLLPDFSGGFQNSFNYGNFELSFLLQFVKQTKMTYEFGSQPGQLGNQPTSVLGYWRQQGDNADKQKVSSSFSSSFLNAQLSDLMYGNGSFIRLKNAIISYRFPQEKINKIGLKGLRIYMQGQNLLTISNFIGLDPETRTALPPLRVITAGLQINL